MKALFKYTGLLLLLAIAGGIAYLVTHPDASEALQNKLDSYGAEEPAEVTPVRELAVTYDFPEALRRQIDDTYQCGQEWLHQMVFTYFKDLGGDLWLPFIDERAEDRVFAVLFCNADGEIVSQSVKDGGACGGDGVSGEMWISENVLAELPEGAYWLAALFTDGSEYNRCLIYYLSVHDRCTFHTEAYAIAAGGRGGEVLFDRTAGEDFTLHLCNLGDNRVVGLQEMTKDDFMGYRYNKVADKYFTVSENGSSVTLNQEYLSTLKPLYTYDFRFVLADGTSFDSQQNRRWEDGIPLVIFTDGPLADPPILEGPGVYSLSSGGDLTFTYHMGSALEIYSCEIVFYDSDEEREGLQPLPLSETAEKDGTVTIPKSMLQEGWQRGIRNVYVQMLFRMSDHRMNSYWRSQGFSVDFVP